MPINQHNLLTLKEIHIRTELWKDHIYYISNSPYKFPKNNGQADFLPLPKRFAEILTEFKEAVQKQKGSERKEEEINRAKEIINEIYQEIKGLIEERIEAVEEGDYSIEHEPDIDIAIPEDKKEQDQLSQEQEKAKQEKINQLKLGLKKTTISQLQRFNDEHLKSQELTQLLQEWEVQKKITLDRKNICFILQDTQDTFQFCYQPPRGNFPALTDFLWYRNNIWYETTNWTRINHENAIITAQRSFFIHNYPIFFSQGANGVLHHTPKFKNKDEICQCPSFLESTEYAEFTADWQPEYQLFKLDNFQGTAMGTISNAKGEYPVFHTLQLSPVNLGDWFHKDVQPTSFFLLPSFYNMGIFSQKTFSPVNFVSSKNKTPLIKWIENAKMERLGHDGQGGKYEHLLKHVNVNYFWGSKKIHESNLDEIDEKTGFKIIVRANPAGIMYKFESKKVLFRYSEDLTFTLDADQLEKASRNMLIKGAAGALNFFTGGIAGEVAGEVLKQEAGLGDATKNYLHSGKDDKSKDERQSERKKTLASAGNNAIQTVLGAIPSILDASHTHGNYSLAELALRFESIQFWIRLELNKNLNERYQKMKGLKKNGNEVFNTEKIGNILAKGYFKIVPNIFEGDKNGYFAGIFSKGVYVYEEHPHEYFLEKLEVGKIERGILNKDPVGTNTTIQVNYKSSVGRDGLVHVDDMSWVWKDSYCRPQGGGTDLFPQLINGMRHNIKRDDANAWKFDGYSKGESPATLQKGVKYEWFMHAFSSGERDEKAFTGLDDGVKVILRQDGADWELAFEGRVEITETIGNPDAIGSGVEIDDVEEIVPDLEDEQQTEGLDNMDKDMEPEAEESKQEEKQEEEEQQEEQQQEEQKEDELEQEDEKDKEKAKEKQKQKEEEQDDEQQDQHEDSRQNER